MEGGHDDSPGFRMFLARVQHDLPLPRSVTTTFIKPAKKTEPLHWVTLTNLDRLFDSFYSPLILYYPYQQGREASGESVNVEKLKELLAEVLVAFYPLAGRVVQNDNEVPKLHCNDAGVVFTEAYLDGVVLDDLKVEMGYHPAPQLNGMAYAAGLMGESQFVFSAEGDGIPPLVIQATVFRCGGISLAVNWNHQIADGFSGCQFLKAWSDVYQGKPIFPFPVHDRTIIQPRNPPQVNVDITNTVRIIHPGPPLCPSAEDPLQTIVINIEDAFAEKLKAEASKEGRGPFTSLDCLCAHLWRVRERLEDPGGNQQAQFTTLVNGRRKLSPPPPPCFLSNVLVNTYVGVAADELLSRPLSYSAGLIRGAIRQVEDETLRSTVDWVELQGNNANVSFSGPQLDWSKALRVSSWATFPLYELDYGWGPPAFALRNSRNYPHLNGFCFIFPPPPSHGKLIVLLHLPQSFATKLLSNPSLLHC